MYNMIKNTLMVIAAVLIGLVISGCAEHSIPTVNDTVNIQKNAANAAVNTSEQAKNTTTHTNNDFSLSFNLEKPPKEVVGG